MVDPQQPIQDFPSDTPASDTPASDTPALEGEADASVGESLTALVHAVYRGIAAQVNSDNISPLDFAVLRSFLRQEEWTTTALANKLPVTASRISRVVTRLVDMDLISRRRLRDDRRVVMLQLTDEGSALTLKLHQRVQAYDARLVEGISEERLAEFMAVTAQIMANYAAIESDVPE